jgi:hypothetical protein
MHRPGLQFAAPDQTQLAPNQDEYALNQIQLDLCRMVSARWPRLSTSAGIALGLHEIKRTHQVVLQIPALYNRVQKALLQQKL